jgi:hypothetical protein
MFGEDPWLSSRQHNIRLWLSIPDLRALWPRLSGMTAE